MTSAVHSFSPQTNVEGPRDFDFAEFALQASGSSLARRGAQAIRRPTSFLQLVEPTRSADEAVADAVRQAKRWTGEVAMRLPDAVRNRVFAQIDRLHDPDEWFEDSTPLNLTSYQTFIRAILSKQVGGIPALALSGVGNLVGVWEFTKGRLVIEFQASDKIRYIVTRPLADGVERLAGDTWISRIRELLPPADCESWFDGGEKATS